MFLHLLRVIRVRHVSHVQRPPRRRLLQVVRIVAHVSRLLRAQIVEVVVVPGHVRKQRPVAGQVAVQQVVEHVESLEPLLLPDQRHQLVPLGVEQGLLAGVQQADAVEKAAVVVLGRRVHEAVADGHAAKVDDFDAA